MSFKDYYCFYKFKVNFSVTSFEITPLSANSANSYNKQLTYKIAAVFRALFFNFMNKKVFVRLSLKSGKLYPVRN